MPEDSFLEYDEDQEFVAYMPEVADLKAQDGGPILAHSGVRLAQALVRADLTYFLINPIAHDGSPLFTESRALKAF